MRATDIPNSPRLGAIAEETIEERLGDTPENIYKKIYGLTTTCLAIIKDAERMHGKTVAKQLEKLLDRAINEVLRHISTADLKVIFKDELAAFCE